MQKYPRVNDCAVYVAKEKNISVAEAKGYIFELLAKLSEFGAITLKPDASFKLAERVRFGFTWRVRHEATVLGFLRATTRAYGIFVLAPALLTGFYYMVYGMQPVGIMILITAMAGLMGLSFAVHELAHVFVARLQGICVILLSRVGYTAVAYTPKSRRTTVSTSMAGPLASALACGAGAFVLGGLLAIFCWALAFAHLLSLLPWFADGKAIWGKVNNEE